MKNVTIKFYRDTPDDIKSYGPLVSKRLDALVGGPDRWDMSRHHGVAKVPGTTMRVERHEDGPELLNLVVTQLPNYVSALAAVASAWLAYRAQKKTKEQRTVKVRIGTHSYEGPVKNAGDLRKIVAVLKGVK